MKINNVFYTTFAQHCFNLQTTQNWGCCRSNTLSSLYLHRNLDLWNNLNFKRKKAKNTLKRFFFLFSWYRTHPCPCLNWHNCRRVNGGQELPQPKFCHKPHSLYHYYFHRRKEQKKKIFCVSQCSQHHSFGPPQKLHSMDFLKIHNSVLLRLMGK